MKAKTIIILLFAIVLASCKKEVVKCSYDKEFCAFVNSEEYNKTSTAIDEYLKSINKGLPDNEKLELLREWLECKSCVTNAEILCYACIYTNPAQSELRVTFFCCLFRHLHISFPC